MLFYLSVLGGGELWGCLGRVAAGGRLLGGSRLDGGSRLGKKRWKKSVRKKS